MYSTLDRFRLWVSRLICGDRLYKAAVKNYHWQLQAVRPETHNFEIILKDNLARTVEQYNTDTFVLAVETLGQDAPFYARSGGRKQLEAYLLLASHVLREIRGCYVTLDDLNS